MSTKLLPRIFPLIILVGLLLSLTQSGGMRAKALVNNLAAHAAQEDPLDKIEQQIIDEITVNGQTDFFVVMKEQADLSAAASLNTKVQKGKFVFNTLRSTADSTQKDLRTYLDQQGVKYRSFYIVNMILVRGGSQDLLMSLASRTDVESVTANHAYKLEEPIVSFDPAAPAAIEPNLTFVNADDVWAMGITGQGTVLAGNTSGLSWTHPAIQPHYRGWNGATADHNYNWWDATGTYPAVPNDINGHGTHNTGTMVGDDGAANQIGMAPGAKTIHCKNVDDGGSGQEAWALVCFEWDLAPWDLTGFNPDPLKAPDAVNNAWSTSGGTVTYRTAIGHLQAAGIAVVAVAGNGGPGCSTLKSPGDYQEVLTAGSVNHAGGFLPGTISSFSSRGPSLLDSPYFPDIIAPGENVRSCVPGGTYTSWSGTSMSASHVTALIGLIWSANPVLRGQIDQTYHIILNSAVPLTGQNGSTCGGDYTVGPNNDWGYGTINALAAVQTANPPTPTPTVTQTPIPTSTPASTETSTPTMTSTPTPTATAVTGPSKLFLSLLLRNFPWIIFKDNFSADLGWTVITDQKGSAFTRDGIYLMQHKGMNKYVFSLAPIPSLLPSRTVVEMDVHRDSGNDMRYGIVFDWIDKDHFYLLLINPNSQTYYVFKYDNGYQSLATGTSAYINPNNLINHLAVRKDGITIKVFANGTLISSATGIQTDPHSQLGLVITSGANVPAQATYDNFFVTGWLP